MKRGKAAIQGLIGAAVLLLGAVTAGLAVGVAVRAFTWAAGV